MIRSFRWVVAACVALFGFSLAMQAEAVKLRRPYAENITFNYGFDNNPGGNCQDFNCGTHCYGGHTGTDHAMPVGTNVLSGEEGTVTAVNNNCNDYGSFGNTCGGRCGNYVKVQHPDGQFSLYCHLRLNSLTVSVGQSVSCGQKIGESASSGSSTGPHLHVAWQSSAGTRDLFRGSCTSSPGAWREQRGYREPVGTSCGCEPSPEVCDGKDNNCSGKIDDEEVCEIELLELAPTAYDPPRTTDINGDGLQDVCGRFPEGWGCFLATGTGWGERIQTDLFTDEGGWGAAHYYSTIRMGDIDGDGRADVCARHSTRGYRCYRSTGDGFKHYADVPGFTNDDGWKKPEYYTTFRLADINGDGMDDVCARGPEGWSCVLSTGDGFGETVKGPEWKDDSGYNKSWYYGTIRIGNLNGDDKMDVCIRRSAGFDCYISKGDKFERYDLLEDFSNDGGWDEMQYWSTLRLVDFDGDGLDDVCARFYSGMRCLRNNGNGFDSDLIPIADLDDATEWNDRTVYSTIRAGDISGDGGDDICVRTKGGMRCFGVDSGSGFTIDGPAWSDEQGWGKPHFYETIHVTDIDSDRRRDLCARGSAGLSCSRYTDDGFKGLSKLEEVSNANGWDDPKYYSTLRLGTGTCGEELCNGFDDNCDGQIDEGYPTKMGPVPPAIAADFIDATLPDEVQIGDTVQAKIRFKNVGLDTWGVGQIALRAAADSSDDIAQIRATNGWIDDTVTGTLEAETAPEEIATLTFDVTIPDDESVFERIHFALEADEKPVACPAPLATIRPGVITGEDVDPGDLNNPPGQTDNNDPGGEPGNNQPGDNSPDAGSSDAGDSEGSMRAVSSSSCSATGASSPLSSPLWAALLAAFGLVGLRRRKRASVLSGAALVLLFFSLTGCDSPGVVTEPAPDSVAPLSEAEALGQGMTLDSQSKELADTDAQLLAIWGEWALWGHPLKALPNSDQPPRMIAELTYQQRALDWPLGEEPLTSASFVAPTAAGAAPTIAVRTPMAELLLIELDRSNPAKSSVTEIDQGAGFIISTATKGCCLAYMKGDLGFQSTLAVLDSDANETRTFDVGHNAWSPAISPDGAQVIYVSPTDDGSAGIYLQDVHSRQAPKLLVEGAEVFPSGPQPPVWTEDDTIIFPAETGVYQLDLDGQITTIDPKAEGLLVDLKTGALLDEAGRKL